jgi:hypothetical protein
MKSRTPLPGSMMPREEQEKLTPGKKLEVANDRKPKPQYSDDGDKDQTVPI